MLSDDINTTLFLYVSEIHVSIKSIFAKIQNEGNFCIRSRRIKISRWTSGVARNMSESEFGQKFQHDPSKF